ncbi:GNAT family N-acetyltransferase [Weissella paramesenteroides]|uniref:GNAT family N-acetyltransferase n=1 Tax=Weissella paramesenteroides TaxID=1249 RepID=UPI002072D6A2|nr:GNAT family protein [Weissella paramesenteroides]MCM6765527.1 GNAT family N-acetyltransferase [Weissella paramesenteroides]MCM6766898.1 GNAT family N-acetyltransferase [Weissella paramesenteroides]MCM6769302.1 GNAT family N-acetyltransferase [Weissella paramesenteroides]MCM6771338.1 GNAT family N-acetyltransferase [Weissella paramesenteroides]MCM6779569.1 GNAT family N-acetyltransferase [Weissella paramesenteroides]
MFTYQIDDEVSLALPRPKIDAEAIFQLIDESRNELVTWLPWVTGTTAVADEEKFLANDLEKFGTSTSMTTIILYKNHPAGMISFNRFREMDQSAEIGYWLGTRFIGKGIMHRAVVGMCQIGFNDYKVNKIEIHAAVDNARSNHVAQKAGFHLDGTIRADKLLSDGFHDGNIWTMLKDDWEIVVNIKPQ